MTVFPFSRVTFSFGPLLKVTSTSAEPGRIVQDTLYGAELFSQVGAQAALRVDARDQPTWTTRGLRLDVGVSIYPALLDVAEVFGKLHGEMTAYVSVPVPTEPTFAVRIGGVKVWGRVPFHEAAYLGGEASLRGFELQRFAGDAAVYGSADIRLTLAKFFALFPTELGVLGLADVGRVYLQGTSPGGWHADGGGGNLDGAAEARLHAELCRCPQHRANGLLPACGVLLLNRSLPRPSSVLREWARLTWRSVSQWQQPRVAGGFTTVRSPT